MAATARIKLERTATIMAALETSSVRPALEVGQSPNAFFVNVTKCKATATTDLLCPIPTHSHINCLLICCPTNKNSIPQKLLPNDGLGGVPQYLSRTKWDQGKGNRVAWGGWHWDLNWSSNFCLCSYFLAVFIEAQIPPLLCHFPVLLTALDLLGQFTLTMCLG